ncbi:SocA family protein [Luteolibacter yonseiensis]|uniref:SocA family protein n=1 Tax=Luteolibacter yonseiensis TaxID=1144680 RepID=A0A934VBV4_9BACT|nr:Panacea domain-containing protein [Luteolibacter yonseiensis]MBK1815829.1 SocA family protein [Luteolibacter yonseiensis]
MSISNPTPREREAQADNRLAEMILFIAQKCNGDPKFGATKLNKILFFADFFSFVKRGKPIVGCDFMRLGKGPAPRHMKPVRDSLVSAGRAVVQERQLVSGHTQHKVLALKEPDLSEFSGEDINFMLEIICALKPFSAEEVSELSHSHPAWEIAEDKESIPLEAAFIMSMDHEESDIATALGLHKKLKHA